jgi:AmmeMemoRadiSam system protein B
MIRKPAVAGLFYESNPESLRKRIKWCYQHQLGPGRIPDKIGKKRTIKGLMAPHAGYQYSGPVAAHSYLELAEDGFPETVVIMCPNHTGLGSGVSTMTEGTWQTPLGNVQIDEEFAIELVSHHALMDTDPAAHLQEHSCEVQLPFLQYIGPDFSLVPVCMWMQDLETASELGEAIAETSRKLGRDIVIIASTDFTHYQPQEVAKAQDKQVLEAIKAMNEKLLMKRVAEHNVTMCGYGPVAAALVASKAMGANSAEILKYATSGDATGDYSSVVGYASAVFR